MKYLALLFVISIALLSGAQSSGQNCLLVSFLDVGQGDAVLIQTPYTGHTILVDGGPDDRVVSLIDEFLPAYNDRIDLMVLTHNHADHVSGLINVLETHQVSAVLISGDYSESDVMTTFFGLIAEKHIPVFIAHKNEDIQVGPLTLDVLFPIQYRAFTQEKNPNNASVALRIVYGDQSLLLTGDSEIDELAALFASGETVKSTLFKAAHHGSMTGIYPPFLLASMPHFVTIQSGLGNQYGHPHEVALDFFNKHDMHIYRTDLLGTLQFAL